MAPHCERAVSYSNLLETHWAEGASFKGQRLGPLVYHCVQTRIQGWERRGLCGYAGQVREFVLRQGWRQRAYFLRGLCGRKEDARRRRAARWTIRSVERTQLARASK